MRTEHRDRFIRKTAEILVTVCGAGREIAEEAADGAWRYLASRPNLGGFRFPFEYRFMGALGFGGKLRADLNHEGREAQVYVNCYPEDETPEVMAMITQANALLPAVLFEGPAPNHTLQSLREGEE